MFSGRTSELKYLNTYYDRKGSQILVVYGHKNTGKTSLMFRFLEDKPGAYYLARSASEREQRYQWGKELARKENDLPEYPSFKQIFSALTQEKILKKVIVIDEFQNIVKSDGSFIYELVEFVRSIPAGKRVMVVLCSSSLGWVENSMVNKIGEAAYDLSGFLKIRGLSFEDMLDFFPGFSTEQCITAYAVLGGNPGFWEQFDDRKSIKENICQSILEKEAFLYGEGQRIVEEELRETGIYNTILASISAGRHKLNELYLHTGFSRAKISVYLKNLMELELVEKVCSYDPEGTSSRGREGAQKGIYRISNHFVNFYFTYLYPNISSLQTMRPEEFYDRFIAPSLKNYVSDCFQEICRQQLERWNKRGRLPIEIKKMGEWVGKMGDIHFVGQAEDGKTLIGFCSWDKPMMRYDDYEWLLFCAQKAQIRTDFVYLFSARSFDEKLNLEAKIKQNLKLISMDEL